MITVNDKRLYSTQAIVSAASNVWPAGERFGSVLDAVENHPALGFEVRGANMSREGETRFADVDMLAVVLGWPADRVAAVKDVLRVQRSQPDNISGLAVSISRAEQRRLRDERNRALDNFITLPRAADVWILRGRAQDPEDVVVHDFGPAARGAAIVI